MISLIIDYCGKFSCMHSGAVFFLLNFYFFSMNKLKKNLYSYFFEFLSIAYDTTLILFFFFYGM